MVRVVRGGRSRKSSKRSKGSKSSNVYRIFAATLFAICIVLQFLKQDGTKDAFVHVEDDVTKLFLYSNSFCNGTSSEMVHASRAEPVIFEPASLPLSAKVQGDGLAEVFYHTEREYKGALMQLDGCYDFNGHTNQLLFHVYSSSNKTTVLTSKRQVPDALQRHFSTENDFSKPHTRIIFSATSSHYFGYQVYANAYAFLKAKPTNSTWLRLLTSRQPDDLADVLPTFTAPKALQSDSYNPINKPDIITKWFHSKDAPHPDDIIVVVDPDSWILGDLSRWTRAVANKQAIGMEAYYYSDGMEIQKLWKQFCFENCDGQLALVGVPYVLKASDLKDVAPLWKHYTLMIKEKLTNDESFAKQYEWLGIDWSAEMFGFNFASSHLNITTKAVNDLQVRDVETTHELVRWKDHPMIHTERAWFPKEAAELAAPWQHSDDGGMPEFGIQVWCKCNETAGEILPWPLPPGLDFVSEHTLRILYESREHFGPIPINETFRKPGDYYWAAP